jgi:hypothetical protein
MRQTLEQPDGAIVRSPGAEQTQAMYAVINTMTLAKPLDADVTERMQDELMADAHDIPGFREAHFVEIGPDRVVMIVVCDSADSVTQLHDRIGSPWIGANLGPYLAGTDRQVGPVLASSIS